MIISIICSITLDWVKIWRQHPAAVYISGFFEVLGGVCVLIPRLRKIAGWGLVALLVAVYPANIYMAITPEAFNLFSF